MLFRATPWILLALCVPSIGLISFPKGVCFLSSKSRKCLGSRNFHHNWFLIADERKWITLFWGNFCGHLGIRSSSCVSPSAGLCAGDVMSITLWSLGRRLHKAWCPFFLGKEGRWRASASFPSSLLFRALSCKVSRLATVKALIIHRLALSGNRELVFASAKTFSAAFLTSLTFLQVSLQVSQIEKVLGVLVELATVLSVAWPAPLEGACVSATLTSAKHSPFELTDYSPKASNRSACLPTPVPFSPSIPAKQRDATVVIWHVGG